MVEQKRNSAIWKWGLIGLSAAILAGVFFMVSDSSLNINGKSLIEFEKTGQMNFPRFHPATVQLKNGNVLACGGSPLDESVSFSDVPCEVYDWEQGRFLNIEKSPVDPWGSSMVLLSDGRVFISGGGVTGEPLQKPNKTFFYNPGTGKFDQGPDMPYPRVQHSSILTAKGKVLIFGGRIGDTSTDTPAMSLLYDPVTNEYKKLDNPNYRYGKDGLTPRFLMPDGKILIISKKDKVKKHNFGELFDEQALEFQVVPDNAAFNSSAIALLRNGMLVSSDDGLKENIFFVGDPYTGDSESIASLSPGHFGLTTSVTSLRNGNALFVGGQQSGWSAKHADVKLYDSLKNQVIDLGNAHILYPIIYELPNNKVLILGGHGSISAELLILSEM